MQGNPFLEPQNAYNHQNSSQINTKHSQLKIN